MLPERTGLDSELVGLETPEIIRHRKVSIFFEVGTAVAARKNDDDAVVIVRRLKADSDVVFLLACLRDQYLAVAVSVDLVQIGCVQGVDGRSNPLFVAQLCLHTIVGLSAPLWTDGWRGCRRVDWGLSAAPG